MQQKNTNSIRYDEKQEAHRESIDKDDHKEAHEFYSDEEPENQASQKEDMKVFLNKLNNRIDTLVDALKKADNMIVKSKDQKTMMDQIKERRTGENEEGGSIAQFF